MVSTDSGQSVHWAHREDLERIWSWNKDVPEAVDGLVHQIIEKRALEQPEAPAVCAWDGNLTYDELDTLSSRLAHHLATIGIQSDTIVPLCFEKSMWTVVAILGVLKAGGSFVLLDATQPLKRLEAILQQVNAKCLCSSAKSIEMLGKLSKHIVVVDHNALGKMESVKPTGNRPSRSHTATLYVVFTSGSTGTPKGVIITHRNFATAITYQASVLGLDSQSRVLDFSSYSFDVTIYNTLATLCTGGCVCIPSEQQRRTNIACAMEKMGVNLANFTPTGARLFTPEDVPSLKTLILLGEPVTEADGKTWAKHARLINAYGPSECGTMSTANLEITDWSKSSSIGRGLGAVTWIVDPEDHNILLPIGAIGELLIEGPIVGAGYLHDLERMDKAYIRHPTWLSQGPFQRIERHGCLYCTGDLVQYNIDGTLKFIGRRDTQVKIRGHRLELSEVENHVWRVLGVIGISSSVVAELVTPSGEADPLLAVFISVRSKKEELVEKANKTLSLAIKELEERLIALVPMYMVPTAYVPIRELPTTATGKTDRRQLRQIAGSMTIAQLAALTPSVEKRRSPETSMERALQQLWAEILGIGWDRISVTDSFLRLGGDSIRAIRLVEAARKKGFSLTVATIFKHPRLYDLAKQVKPELEHKDASFIEPFCLLKPNLNIRNSVTQAASLCNVDHGMIEDIFPCTPLQEGLLAITARRSGDYTARLVFPLNRTNIELDRLLEAWQELAETVAILRTRIIDLPQQGLVQAVIKEPLRCTTGHDNLQYYLDSDKEQKIGLGTPLNWLAIVKDNSENFAVWTIHHALYDEWSLSLMLKKLEHFYFGGPHPRQSSLQSFVRYILDSNKGHAESYWRAQLTGCEAVVFPKLPQPLYEPHADGVVKHCITNIHWPPSDITASTFVRAAWSLLIARYTDSQDVLFGATVTGRQATVSGVETIIGPTIVTVPVRVVVDWTMSIEGFLQQVQSQALDMITFEQTGLQQIRRIDPGTERGSVFQTLLVIQPREQGDGVDQDERLIQPIGHDTDDTDGFGAFSFYAITALCPAGNF